jgi:predicted Zn-dependent protease
MVGKINRILSAALALSFYTSASLLPATAEPIPRGAEAAGSVIARKSGEEVRFIDVSSWRFVDLRQDLLPGDVLRTNATGQLAILFSDRTQIRLGRNSSLRVRRLAAGSDAELELQAGTIWARAERGGPGVLVDTPAASAAIRGTDWTMTVNGAKTSLTVLEGVVEFSNKLGQLQVAQGEAAVATIGQAPRKVVIVESDDREQMLFYLAPRNAFNFMPASPLPVAGMRREADRIGAIPPSRRSTADLLTLAETQLTLEGRDRAKTTLASLRARSLSAQERARANLIEAIIAAAEKRYSEAARLFDSAAPGLDSRHRAIALYGRYYARSLANPNRVEPLPAHAGGPYAALLKAYTTGFLKDIRAAIDIVRDAERQYPDDASLPAYRAQFALLLNDRAQVQEAIARSLALDPSEPVALEARANFRAGVQSDLDGALADLEAAAKVVPGSTTIWNAIGNLQSQRGDMRAAEAAFKTSIALDPQDPVSHANLAVFYLDQSRVKEAKAEIDRALAADPSFDLALIARGRYHMQAGQPDKALDDLLAGTVANPAYAQGQILLSAAHYENGDRVPSEQAIDNANRLDDNDPVISAVRAAIAIDRYDSEGAIRNAQEFLKRGRIRGGQYAELGANQDAGSILNNAFRLQGLNAWGEYYGDAVFDPFAGSAFIDQMLRGSVTPFANSYVYDGNAITNAENSLSYSSAIQGLLLDPGMLASPSLSANLITKPFLEAALGGGMTYADGKIGHMATAALQGYSNLPFPVSFYADANWEERPELRSIAPGFPDLHTANRLLRANVFLAANPTPYDRVVAYVNHRDSRFDLDIKVPVLPLFIDADTRSTSAGIGVSHTIGYRDVVNAGLFFTDVNSQSADHVTSPLDLITADSSQRTYVAALNHTIGVGDFTWRYGIEAGRIETRSQFAVNGVPAIADPDDRATYGLAYVDLIHEMTPGLKAEYALHAIYLDGDSSDFARLEPRAGLAWSPGEGHWLRAALSRQSLNVNTPTLSPVGILGLQPNEMTTSLGGHVDTAALRWDAEWTPDFFTAAEFQHQEIRKPEISKPLAAFPFSASDGRIDRASLTGNLLLGQGFGLSSTLAYANSEVEDPASLANGHALPFVPGWAGQVALTWVNEANVKATLAANYIGERSNEVGTRLDDYWTLDARITWEPFDKRMVLELAGYNLLDKDFVVNTNMPGWGRSFWGSMKVRF